MCKPYIPGFSARSVQEVNAAGIEPIRAFSSLLGIRRSGGMGRLGGPRLISAYDSSDTNTVHVDIPDQEVLRKGQGSVVALANRLEYVRRCVEVVEVVVSNGHAWLQ